MPPYPAAPVLIVDDEAQAIEGTELSLNADGIRNAIGCQDSRDAMSIIAGREISVLLLDLRMPHRSGQDIMEEMANRHPHIPVIVFTGVDDVTNAVDCMKAGAFDYLLKPVDGVRLTTAVRRAVALWEERRAFRVFKDSVLSDSLHHPEAFSEIITRSKAMRGVFQYLEAIAGTGKPVLITGETGVGKELLARALHTLSEVKGPFVAENVAGLDTALFSDALFGHATGAFTGAHHARDGLIAQAAEGTLFLDEIGDLDHSNQIKLLRLLQEGSYFPVGADVPREATARIVTATNRDLLELRESGEFRVDLYYRLESHHVHIPPLRERPEDLPLLVNHFLDQASRECDKKKPGLPKGFLSILSSHDFPGNVRELEGMLFDAVSSCQTETLSMEPFTARMTRPDSPADAATNPRMATPEELFSHLPRLPTLREVPALLIAEAMKRADQNQTIAAQLLGISRSGLNKALRRAAAK